MIQLYLKCNDCGEVFDEMGVINAYEHTETQDCENNFSIVTESEAY